MQAKEKFFDQARPEPGSMLPSSAMNGNAPGCAASRRATVVGRTGIVSGAAAIDEVSNASRPRRHCVEEPAADGVAEDRRPLATRRNTVFFLRSRARRSINRCCDRGIRRAPRCALTGRSRRLRLCSCGGWRRRRRASRRGRSWAGRCASRLRCCARSARHFRMRAAFRSASRRWSWRRPVPARCWSGSPPPACAIPTCRRSTATGCGRCRSRSVTRPPGSSPRSARG